MSELEKENARRTKKLREGHTARTIEWGGVETNAARWGMSLDYTIFVRGQIRLSSEKRRKKE